MFEEILKQLIAIYDSVYKWSYKVDLTVFWKEISGFLLIVLLLIIIKRLRKHKKAKHSVILKDDLTIESQPVSEGIDETEEAGEGQDDVSGELTTVPDETPEQETPAVIETFLPAEPEPGSEPVEIKKESPGFFNRLKSGLTKTRQTLTNRLDAILSGNRKIDDDVLEEIEEALITSDIGIPTTMALIERISKKADKISTVDEFKTLLKKEMLSLVTIQTPAKTLSKPYVIMVVGVNGVGKTTTIGKLAAQFTSEGKKVLLAAADTFRAAAVEQLDIWAERANAEIVKHKDKADPAAVAFDSIEAAIARDVDIVIVDTAGRLHTKVNLMEQLKKIKRSISKKIPQAPHETLLILDATTGQNAVSQAKLFNEDINISGIVLTKLDGTAKGGIVLSISSSLNIPIEYVGIGEGIEDLQKFDPKLFIDALL